MHRNFYYFVAYSLALTSLLVWSLYDLLLTLFDDYLYLWRLTEGFKKAILINFMAIFYLWFCRALQLIVFGELRLIEIEHLTDRLPMFALTLLFNWATTDKEMIVNVFLIGLSIAFKVFHIILMDRMDFYTMKIVNGLSLSTTRPQVLAQFGLNLYFWLVGVAVILDFMVAKLLVYDILRGIASVVCLLFGFQFAMQGVEALTYFAKLLLTAYEILVYRVDPPFSETVVAGVWRRLVGGEVQHHENLQDEGAVTEDAAPPSEEVSPNAGSADSESSGPNTSRTGLDALLENMSDEEDDDFQAERVWEAKPYYSKGIDIGLALLKAVSHVWFIYLLIYHLGVLLPIAMVSGTYLAVKEVWTEVGHLVKFVELARQLDLQLPSATEEELESVDNLCIICMEDMRAPTAYARTHGKELNKRKIPKKLRCGHFMHAGCLKEWLERTDSCPLCRSKVFGNEPLTPEQETEELLRNIDELDRQPPPPQPGARPAPPGPTGAPEATPVNYNEAPRDQNQANSAEQPLTSSTQTFTEPPTPTRTTPVQLTSAAASATPPAPLDDSLYQTIRLPTTAILPPNWILLPLRRTGDSYEVSISRSHTATMTVDHNPHKTNFEMHQ